MSDNDKLIEELRTEIVGLKIRLSRIEEYLRDMPEVSDYFPNTNNLSSSDEKDELFDEAVKLVREHEAASAALLQRRFYIGFNRASRLLDQLSEEGIIEKGYGAKPRKVIEEEK